MIVISKYQAEPILKAIEEKKTEVKCSLDLGKTITVVQIDHRVVKMPDGKKLISDDFELIAKKDVCYFYEDGKIMPVTLFSGETQRYYKLLPYPTNDPLAKAYPTIEISGIRMHQFSHKTPMDDTIAKVKVAKPRGIVLDTCCGLGYTSIYAALNAEKVYTVEIDKNVTEIAKYNPWSEELFTRPNIEYLSGDVFNVIGKFKENMFDVIIHDPPTLKLGGDLYSLEFYKKLFKTMKPGGTLYHYTGKPGSKARGIDLSKGCEKRLKTAGFEDIRFDEGSLGMVAVKPLN